MKKDQWQNDTTGENSDIEEDNNPHDTALFHELAAVF
jgi:hypothetical protein